MLDKEQFFYKQSLHKKEKTQTGQEPRGSGVDVKAIEECYLLDCP